MSRYEIRNGFTLLGLLVVMSVGSLLLMLAITWIGETMKFVSRTSNHRDQHQQLTHLGRNLRNDVHLSQAMTMDSDERLVLQGAGDERTVYSISGATIEMEKRTGAQVSRERYPLVAGSVVEWDTSGMPDSIGLIVYRSQIGKPAIGSEQAVSADGLSNREVATLVKREALPIDIHIFAHANRWAGLSSEANQRGGLR
jgi:hypothetical protein